MPATSIEAPPLSAFFKQPVDLIDRLLADQHTLTPVDRFSALKDSAAPGLEPWYRELIPLRQPHPGEQYAFEVDLDRCSGCKACVTACHSLNGLDEDETWRQVGLLHFPPVGAMHASPLPGGLQHVTSACHHCLEPSCAQGCPTLAYEKDPQTGVVRHLDDQCFGCQYCVLKCPYDVPQYQAGKGIVRKCDMCIGRLRAGEAPACVQACPTQAIRIALVETETIRREPEREFALPGTADPRIAMPSTRYRSKNPSWKSGLRPVDAHQVKPEPAHWPLVFMLVASQAAIGFWLCHAFAFALHGVAGWKMEAVGLALTLASLALSPLHLGRPWLAWKAFLNWRRSWLSREVLAFGVLAGTSFLAFAAAWVLPAWQGLCLTGVAAAALASLYASAMVYRDTPRALWATPLTLLRFALTALLCGTAAYAAAGGSAVLGWTLPPVLLAKLALEARVLRHRDDREPNPLWKAAQLLTGRLGPVWRWRVVLGITGGIGLPAWSALSGNSVPAKLLIPAFLVAGELLERSLFFATAAAPRMPGGR